MSAMIWDSTTQAFKDAETPKVWDSSANAWKDAEGKIWNETAQAWEDAWNSELWLYNYGDQCIKNTGGWQNLNKSGQPSYSYNNIAPVFNVNNVVFGDTGTSYSKYGASTMVTTKKINTSRYKRVHINCVPTNSSPGGWGFYIWLFPENNFTYLYDLNSRTSFVAVQYLISSDAMYLRYNVNNNTVPYSKSGNVYTIDVAANLPQVYMTDWKRENYIAVGNMNGNTLTVYQVWFE